MKHKYRLTILILSTFLVLGLLTSGILAWLTSTSTEGPFEFSVGEVKYTWQGAFADASDFIVPGQNLVKDNMTLTNTSNVTSEVRVRITVSVDKALDPAHPTGQVITAHDLVNIRLTDGWTELAAIENTNSYLTYYEGVTESNGKYPIPVGTSLNVFLNTYDDLTGEANGISLNGHRVGNYYTGAVFTFTLVFEAKQNDFVKWTELGSINFSTGI